MDIKHILEKLSELDTKHTLLDSAPPAKVLVESTVAEPKRTSIYDVLVSELMAEADYTLPKGKFPNAQGNAPVAEPGAGIANPPPNLNVAPPPALTPTPNITAPANAPAAAPAANAKPGFADRVSTAFQKNNERFAAKQAADAQAEKDMTDPAAQERIKATLSPEQLKYLGGANPADPNIMARLKKAVPDAPKAAPAANTAANAQAQQADMDASSQGATPASDLAKANAQDQQADMDASSQPVATTSPVAPPAPAQVTTSDPAAPAVTANPTTTPAVTANPAVTPAKAPYKGSAGAQEIQKLNPAIKDVNKIQPGQTLKMPDGSTYTVKPGDTLDRIAKGTKPAGEEATKMPPAKQQDQIGKAPPAAPAPAAKPAPAAPAPFRKELDVDRIKQLSGAPAPAKPGKLDLSVNNPAMNPVLNAKESMERILSIIGSK